GIPCPEQRHLQSLAYALPRCTRGGVCPRCQRVSWPLRYLPLSFSALPSLPFRPRSLSIAPCRACSCLVADSRLHCQTPCLPPCRESPYRLPYRCRTRVRLAEPASPNDLRWLLCWDLPC